MRSCKHIKPVFDEVCGWTSKIPVCQSFPDKIKLSIRDDTGLVFQQMLVPRIREGFQEGDQGIDPLIIESRTVFQFFD